MKIKNPNSTGWQNGLIMLAAVVLLIFFVIDGAVAAEKLNYRLKWLFNASVVGDIWADKQGLFAEQGLKVEVKEGGPERDAIRELEIGRAQFGVASADQVIRAISKGASVVVIAQIFQVNPLQWIYRSDEMKINQLGDLKGQTLGVTFGGNEEAILRTLLAKAGLTTKNINKTAAASTLKLFCQPVEFGFLVFIFQSPLTGWPTLCG